MNYITEDQMKDILITLFNLMGASFFMFLLTFALGFSIVYFYAKNLKEIKRDYRKFKRLQRIRRIRKARENRG